MNKTKLRRARGGFSTTGFSLVELLVVIGIIAILIALLLPALNAVKQKGYIADTKNEISNLQTTISNYYQDFHAFPGPFSNDQIEGAGAFSGGIAMEIYTPGTPPTYAAAPGGNWHVTGAENLVLGLLGGLRMDFKGALIPPVAAFAPSEVGLGPLSLNPNNPKRYGAYMQAVSGSSSLIYTGTLSDPQGGCFFDGAQKANDSPIPEFVDRFPTPMPILYLRARAGAGGVVSYVNQSGTGVGVTNQYDVGDVIGYTSSSIGTIMKESLTPPTHGLKGIQGFNNAPAPIGSMPGQAGVLDANGDGGRAIYDPMHGDSPANNGANAGAYFFNLGVTPSDPNNYETGKPRQVDQYILIAVGPDGIYGTRDDITTFGDVMP